MGRREGQIEGFIVVYREYNFADDTIIQKLQETFGISYEEAQDRLKKSDCCHLTATLTATAEKNNGN